MTVIVIETFISCPIKTVFNASRDLDIHLLSTVKTKEKIIYGRASGLIEKGETVTWKAKHFGCWLTHQSVISEMHFPYYFVDEMLRGNFKKFRHEHRFAQKGKHTVMTDTIFYKTPFGFCGLLFDKLILKRYLTQFITERNKTIKSICESNSIENQK